MNSSPRWVSLLSVGGAVLAIVVGTVVAGSTEVGQRIFHRMRAAVGDPAAFVEPGPLSRFHAAEPDLENCQACHDLTGAPPNGKCLVCHESVGDSATAERGWHGTFDGACVECHRDHQGDEILSFDRSGFNHAQAEFDLDGAHRALACNACHLGESERGMSRMTWQGLVFEGCESCHADPHAPSLGADCTRCHQSRGWTGRDLRFSHNRDTSFALSGKHAAVTCADCHPPTSSDLSLAAARLKGTPATCAGCHESPHTPEFSASCNACHTEQGWTGRDLLFDHALDSDFRLEGIHAQLACAACHDPRGESETLGGARFTGTPRNCASCHEDPHGGRLGTSCADCHGRQAWTGRALQFTHDVDTKFPLTGEHRELACTQCHEKAATDDRLAASRLRGTSTKCADCHDNPHRPTFEQDCTACHDTGGWGGRELRLDHARFPLRGAHATAECKACHVPPEGGSLAAARFESLSSGCASCHEDPHAGSLAPKDCTSCHDERAWAPARFDHATDSRFKLDAVHQEFSCVSCHESDVFRPTSMSCTGCHDDVVADLAGPQLPGAARIAPDPHANVVTCVQCHDTTTSGATVTSTAESCRSCHTEQYARLHVERTRRLELLVLGVPVSERKRAAHLVRLSAHNYVPAERMLRKLSSVR